MQRLERWIISTLLLLTMVSGTVVAATPAGTVLRNQAQVSFVDPNTNQVVVRSSNVSQVVVAEFRALLLENSYQMPVVAGQYVTLPHVLENTGNVADTYNLQALNLVGDNGDLSNLQVFQDVNGNGVPDAGEPALTTTPQLQPGDRLELVMAGSVGGGQQDGDVIQVEIQAQSASDAAVVASQQDTLTVASGAYINLTKASSQSCSVPVTAGQTLEYQIGFTNTGTATPQERLLQVSGQPQTGVLIEDALSPAVALTPASANNVSPIQSTLLVHRTGDADDVWLRYDQWTSTIDIDRFGVLVPATAMERNESGGFAFEVTVAQGLADGARINNTATLDLDGDTLIDFSSNTVCNEVSSPALPTLVFQRPAPNVVQAGRMPEHSDDNDFQDADMFRLLPEQTHDVLRDGVYLRLTAEQLNLSPTERDYLERTQTGDQLIIVEVESNLTGDTVNVVMRETGVDTGVFRSIFPFVLSETQSGAGRQCPAYADRNDMRQYDATTTTTDAINNACVLLSEAQDHLTASYRLPVFDGNGNLSRYEVSSDIAAVDPAGTVFDSTNGNPVPDARVILYQSRQPLSSYGVGSCADLAQGDFEVGSDPYTGESLDGENTNISNVDNTNVLGDYQYPYATPGHCYYLDVLPPAGYTFPSVVSPAAAGAFYPDVTDSSYGLEGYSSARMAPKAPGSNFGSFLLGTTNVFVDIPLDPRVRGGNGNFVLDKRAEKDNAAVGDILTYSIDLTNGLTESLVDVRIIDTLPRGFRYVSGSAWLEVVGQRVNITEPSGRPGPQLTFNLEQQLAGGGTSPITLSSRETVTLHYALRLSAAAVDSNGINRAVADARTAGGVSQQSNQDEVEVEIRNEGVLSDRAMVFGKVYVDSDCNNLQNDGEWPIGGVKLYLQDGTWVLTDENGQFSIYGLKPGLHTLKIDTLTLPEGVNLKPIDNRHAADPESRFVDLRAGEYHRADFAASCPSEEDAKALAEQLKARNAAIDGDWMLDEAARFNPLNATTVDSTLRQADGAGDLGSGIYTRTGDGAVDEAWDQVAASHADGQQGDVVAEEVAATMLPTEDAAAQVTREQAEAGTWLWPQDGISRDGRFQVAVRAGVNPQLEVNGQPVSQRQLGEQVANKRERAQVLSWYGVSLDEGENTLRVVAQDMFGNERVMAETVVVRPAAPIALTLHSEEGALPADGGRSTLAIQVALNDRQGSPAMGSYFVTLETARGQWVEDDVQDTVPGHQVKLVNGQAVVHLRSTEYTGPVDIVASLNEFQDTLRIEQVAPLRPLFATGFLQIQSRASTGDDSAPSSIMDDLEDDADGRAALFLKGEVRGGAHLTLAYDTDKELDEEDEIRRDLNPADYYPIPGDASIRGYDARSRSKLYAKLEKGLNSLMWGDYLTDPQNDFFDLGRTQRTLTGINGIYDTGRVRLQLFAARPDMEQVTEELPGNGTAMLFTLSNNPSRDSETVELIVRDRDNPGLVIETLPQTRYVDYSVNYFTGDIRFHDVVPSVDSNLNPVSVRVNYNVEGDAEEYNVMGGRAFIDLTDKLAFSVSRTLDDHETEGFDLSSVTAQYRINDNTRVHVSTGNMSHENNDPEGRAYSVNGQHLWRDGSRTEVHWARAEEGFNNPAAGISESREEMRVNHEERITRDFSVELEGIRSRQLDGSEEENSIAAIAEQRLGALSLRAGVRAIDRETTLTDDQFSTFILGANHGLNVWGKPLQIGGEFEQAFSYSGRQRIAADADLQITEKTSIYSRYELLNSLSGINGLNDDVETQQFTTGVRSALSRNTDVFSEYRLRGAADGRDIAAANGIRSDIELQPRLTLSPSAEWIQSLDGSDNEDDTALSIGLEDLRNPNRRSLVRAETRFGDNREYYGLSAANIWRLNTDWSGVVREDLRLQYFDADPKVGDNIVTLGLARRPRRDNRHHMLFMYKWKEEWGGSSGSDRTVHIFSTHHNYQPHDDWIFSGRIGAKWQETELVTGDEHSDAYVADGRIIWDITRRFDIDFHAGAVTTDGVNERRYSAGVTVNALIRRNLRMGIGFNAIGFSDDDFDPEGYNAQGVYIGLEYKFDEDDLAWLGSKAAGQRSYMGDKP